MKFYSNSFSFPSFCYFVFRFRMFNVQCSSLLKKNRRSLALILPIIQNFNENSHAAFSRNIARWRIFFLSPASTTFPNIQIKFDKKSLDANIINHYDGPRGKDTYISDKHWFYYRKSCFLISGTRFCIINSVSLPVSSYINKLFSILDKFKVLHVFAY